MSQKKQHMGLKSSQRLTNAIIYIILVLMSIIWLTPFVLIVIQSFHCEYPGPSGHPFSGPTDAIPNAIWGFGNYKQLWTQTNFPKWFLNTLIMGCFTAVFQTIIVLCMSYTLSRFRFKMRKPLMKFMLVLGMFPGMLTMIILYRVLSDLGLTQENAVPGLILVYCASSGMGYYVSKGFFDTIPKSLDEAARIDGATRLQILTRIILPLAKPIVIYTILTAFMAPWGDFIFASFVAFGKESAYNVAVGLNNMLTAELISTSYAMFCAGGVCIAIPVALLFIFLQKYYVEGVTGGAVKG